ncbi:MAG: pseudouridine synthase [Clostridiales bacterium]|nr:pseudouridine synthase [Clostridiales bacterium]
MGEVKQTLRLDKYLADLKVGTRTEVKEMIRKSRVTVDGEITKRPEQKVHVGTSEVCVDGEKVTYATFEYYMLNKPAGVVSATSDRFTTTVVDLIETAARKDLFPVGRLDKDTEGLLLITNDGELTHRLLSPKKHVDKVYFAKVSGRVTQEDVKLFAEGLVVDETLTAMPAKLEILKTGDISEVNITIREGKFHQIKRMFEAVDKEVIYLKRLSMGNLKLDESLALGEYRSLTEEEIKSLG